MLPFSKIPLVIFKPWYELDVTLEENISFVFWDLFCSVVKCEIWLSVLKMKFQISANNENKDLSINNQINHVQCYVWLLTVDNWELIHFLS